MSGLFSRPPAFLDLGGTAAHSSRHAVAPTTSATPAEPVADAGDLVARALKILAVEAAAWQARQPADASIGRAR